MVNVCLFHSGVPQASACFIASICIRRGGTSKAIIGVRRDISSNEIGIERTHNEGQMTDLSKRNFLFLSTGAAAGTMLVSGPKTSETEAHETIDYFQSGGLVTGDPKPLKYDAIPGFLSAEQIAPHFSAHYGGTLDRSGCL